MVTEIFPTWEFALHPCLQSVTMLRKPHTMDKLLGMVQNVLSTTDRYRVEMATLSNWQSQPFSDRLRL